SRGAAAHGKTSEHVGCELIIEAPCQTAGLMRQRGAADVGLTIKLPAAVKTSSPGAPARLVESWRRLVDGLLGFSRWFGGRTLSGGCAKGDAVWIDRFSITPERTLIHHQGDERAIGPECSFLRCADAFARESVQGHRQLVCT